MATLAIAKRLWRQQLEMQKEVGIEISKNEVPSRTYTKKSLFPEHLFILFYFIFRELVETRETETEAISPHLVKKT